MADGILPSRLASAIVTLWWVDWMSRDTQGPGKKSGRERILRPRPARGRGHPPKVCRTVTFTLNDCSEQGLVLIAGSIPDTREGGGATLSWFVNFRNDSEVVLASELHPPVSRLGRGCAGKRTVDLWGHVRPLVGSGERQCFIAVAVLAEFSVGVVKPVGCRDAQLDALRIGYPECLEDGQIAAEVSRVADIRPDKRPLLAERCGGWRQRSSKAIGIEMLPHQGLDEMPGIAGQDGHE